MHNVKAGKISVIYEGVSPEYCRGKEEKENYILAVGTIEPRKNIRRLIQSYLRLRDINHIEENLVIVGKQGWSCDDVYDIPEAARDNIIFKGYVSKNELIELYQKAKLFVYPSLYEGFGLPVAEAMACGCPVVTSNLSSLPEVAGNACLLVDPYNMKDIASAILKVLDNDQFAASLTAKGRKQVHQFTWSKCALETKKVYETVLYK